MTLTTLENPTAMQVPEPTPDANSTLKSERDCWLQVLARDPSADGQFVYAVSTTGIYCRPSCPSRRPARQHVCFFSTCTEAHAAGYRACLRCRPGGSDGVDTAWVEKLIVYLRQNIERAVTLEELGELTGMNGLSVQRRFERLLGVTPRQFQVDLRAGSFRSLLSEPTNHMCASITDTVYEAGYSASSRLYSAAQEKLGMRPSRFRDGGRGETIEFTVAACSLGFVLVATTAIGICWVALGDAPPTLEAEFRQRFRHADVTASSEGDQSFLRDSVTAVLSQLTQHPAVSSLPLDLRATIFQQRVWKALTAIPRGETRSYREIANALGQPTAARAVARACASNPVALLVPCHRVVGASGALSGYRWGVERKEQILGIEKS